MISFCRIEFVKYTENYKIKLEADRLNLDLQQNLSDAGQPIDVRRLWGDGQLVTVDQFLKITSNN